MSDHPTSLMLFAAGKGTRMGALTTDLPKPLIPVAGQPLIDHALDIARTAGVDPVVVNVHYLADKITNHLRGSGVVVSDESTRLLETGGGLRQALPMLGEGPVFTLNADAVWSGTNPLVQLREAWQPDRMDALLLLVQQEQADGHTGDGDFSADSEGRLTRGQDLIYTGAQVIATGLLAEIPEPVFSLNRLWDAMLTRGRVYGIVHSGGWCDVGHPEGIVVAERMLKAARGV